MQSYATYTWPWQNPNSVWSPPWMRQATAYQQPSSQHQSSYGYYNNAYYAYEQPQPQPAPPPSSWQQSYSEVHYDPSEICSDDDRHSMFLRLMDEQNRERSGAYYLSASEPEEVMEGDNATYDYVDLQEFLRLMAEQDQERSGAYYLSASEPDEVIKENHYMEHKIPVPAIMATEDYSKAIELGAEDISQDCENVVAPSAYMIFPLSRACLGEIQKDKGNAFVCFNNFHRPITKEATGGTNLMYIILFTLAGGRMSREEAKGNSPTLFFSDRLDSFVRNRAKIYGFCVFDPGGGMSRVRGFVILTLRTR